MGLPVPSSEKLSYLKARYEIENSSSTLGEVLKYVAKSRAASKMLIEVYNYDHDTHISQFNKAIVHRNNGCGCRLCKSLGEYVRSKLYLHSFRKSYNDPDALFGDKNLFNTRYHFHKTTVNDRLVLSEEEYFDCEIHKLEEKIQNLRVSFMSIQDAVNSLLEA